MGLLLDVLDRQILTTTESKITVVVKPCITHHNSRPKNPLVNESQLILTNLYPFSNDLISTFQFGSIATRRIPPDLKIKTVLYDTKKITVDLSCKMKRYPCSMQYGFFLVWEGEGGECVQSLIVTRL